MTKPKVLSWSEIREGQVEKTTYTLTPGIYDAFLTCFGDENPLHMSDDVARKSGFREKVMHSAVLNGFLSHFLGMVLPGRDALLLSSTLRYAAPCYLGDQVTIEGKVQQKVENQKVLVMQIFMENQTQGQVAARGNVQVKVRDPQ